MVFIKIHILLHTDDTVVLAESASELQAAINGMWHYCQIWKLSVNTSKTKVLVFSNGKIYPNKAGWKQNRCSA